jgi:hypothetical protein
MKAKDRKIQKPTEQMVDLLKRTASNDEKERTVAMQALAAALQVPLREGLLNGDILDNIFTPEPLDPGATAEYPLDLYQQHNDGQYVAYTISSEGAIPTRTVVSDSITVQTYKMGNSIDWLLDYARAARWNVVSRAMEVLQNGFIRKMNTDGWRVLISAAAGRTDYQGGAPMVFDSGATAGQFTKRLVSLMKTTMARLAGGNSTTPHRGRLTDLYVSEEALEDIREWDHDEVDDYTRQIIFNAQDESGPLAKIYGVNLHPLFELGVGQEFQNFANSIGVTMGTSDEEIVVGLDLSKSDSFVMPIKEPITVFDDPFLHRRGKAGVYAWTNLGFSCLDPRRVILGSI